MAQSSSKGLKYLGIINGSIKAKTYTFAIFTLLVLVVLIIGAIRPTASTISRISGEIKQKQMTDELLDKKLQDLATLGNAYIDIEEDLENIPMIFPAGGNFSLLMSNIDEISKEYGYTLSAISFGDLEDYPTDTVVLKPFSAKVTVAGRKTNLIKLLEAYEAMPMYPKVKQVSFVDKVESNGLMNFSIELLVYHLEDPEYFN